MIAPETKALIYIGNFIFTAAMAVYLWLRRRHDRNAGRIGELENKIAEIKHDRLERKAEVNTDIAALKEGQAAISKLLDILRDRIGSQEKDLHQISRDTAETKGRIAGIEKGVNLILQQMVEGKKE